ncbi:MAG: hypothetical protein J5611_00975 [Alphaproteobacteria bacterium]|nr:hypothetical protein [Alphaproteobacteria bacterium]
MKKFLTAFCILSVSACNSVYMKPATMEPKSVVYAKHGGYSMKRSVKEALERHGYDVRTGKLRRVYGGDEEDKESLILPGNVKYIVRVNESTEIFRPVWCAFNGFWWWRFSLSITDQKDGKEILSWRGRGCQNSSLRKLDDILDKLEKQQKEEKQKQ